MTQRAFAPLVWASLCLACDDIWDDPDDAAAPTPRALAHPAHPG